MFFKRLDLHGFKSFAEPVSIEFDRGITCVVGPNGSGKSNICDAIRWVLGAQSARTLRGETMEDVIFAGTASRKSRGMAEVTLVIDNTGGELNIAYNEVAITRRMVRSGESEYLINNTPCRMKDIRELVMDTGIGVEGYSIIGQGRISDIISNNTERIREILEETAGIAMYRSKKADAERKLSSASSNMERVNDIIGEVERRLHALKEDRDKAEEYLRLNDRHQALEINITLKQMDDIGQKRNVLQDDLDRLTEELAQLQQRQADGAAHLAGLTEKQKNLDQLLERVQRQQLDVTAAIDQMEQDRRIRRERLDAIRSNEIILREELTRLDEKIRNEDAGAAALHAQKEESEAKVASLQRTLEQKMERTQSHRTALQQAQQHLQDGERHLAELQQQKTNAMLEYRSEKALQEHLRQRGDALKQEQKAGNSQHSHSDRRLAGLLQRKAALEQKSLSLQRKAQQYQQSIEEQMQRERKWSEQRDELKMQISRMTSRKKTIEEMELHYEGYNHAVRFLMKQNLPGIDGVVADLIRVPDGMELAVETALGARMQNIVCETDEVAKRGIRLLKEQRAGRLTFLPVRSIRARAVKRKAGLEQAAGFCGYGAVCVQSAPQYRHLIEYLLGNVLIVDQMDHAVALSKSAGRQYMIVTLEGEVITASGAMTGGRSRQKRVHLLERKSEISHLAQQIETVTAQEQSLHQELERLREQMQTDRTQMQAEQETVSACRQELLSVTKEAALLQSSLNEYQYQTEQRQHELHRVEQEQEESGRRMERIRSGQDDAERQIQEQSAALEQETAQVASDQKQLEQAGQEITALRIALSEAESETSRAEALIEKMHDTIQAFREEQQSREARRQEQEQEKQRLQRSGEGQPDAIRRKKERLLQQWNTLKEKRQAIAAACDEAVRERQAMEETSRRLSSQKTDLGIQQARYDTQLEQARNKLWDTFELSYAQALDRRETDFTLSAAVRENRRIKSRMQDMGNVNPGAIGEYEKVSQRYQFLVSQREDIEASRRELNRIISDMDQVIRRKFKESFDQVVMHFEEVFRDLYDGGHARISLGEGEDPFTSDIEITAQPPGKQLRHINLMSGGEKTMTAIALMFAVLKTKPTPCCILDEVEAALDDANLEIFGNYIRHFQGVQFTLITHQKATMQHADVMYGITMPENGVSRVYSLKMGEKEHAGR